MEKEMEEEREITRRGRKKKKRGEKRKRRWRRGKMRLEGGGIKGGGEGKGIYSEEQHETLTNRKDVEDFFFLSFF